MKLLLRAARQLLMCALVLTDATLRTLLPKHESTTWKRRTRNPGNQLATVTVFSTPSCHAIGQTNPLSGCGDLAIFEITLFVRECILAWNARSPTPPHS